jgi:hypothetical protein
MALAEARGGNMKALELVLDRIWPKRRGRPVEFDLPPVRTIDDVVTAHTAVTEGVLSGALTAQEGSALCDLLERHRSLIADAEFAKAIGLAYDEAIAEVNARFSDR